MSHQSTPQTAAWTPLFGADGETEAFNDIRIPTESQYETTSDRKAGSNQYHQIPSLTGIGGEERRSSSSESQPPGAAGHGSKRRGVIRSVGRLNLWFLMGGPTVAAGTLCFLFYLWAGRGPSAKGDEAGHTWRVFVFNGWLIQAVTVCSLVLRACLLVPATICTSMVAGLMVERQPLPLVHAASMAVHRSVSSGLLSFMEQFVYHRGMSRVLLSPEGAAVTLLAACTIVLQFTSTLLVSDISNPPMPSFPEAINYTLNSYTGDGDVRGVIHSSYSIDRSAEYLSVFGELSAGYMATPNDRGLSDTGLKRHAMLPMDNDRTSIYAIDGPMLVMDSRVQCMPPVLGGVLMLQTWSSGWPNEWKLHVSVNYEETARNAGIEFGDVLIDFIRGQAGPDLQCIVVEANPTLCMISTRSYTPKEWSSDSFAWDSDPYVSLVLDARHTPFFTYSEELDNKTMDLKTSPELNNGEWSTLQARNPDEKPDMRINASLCFYNHNITLYDVEMTAGDAGLSEPRLSWPPSAVNLTGTNQPPYPLDPIMWALGADPALEAHAEKPESGVSDATAAERRGILTVRSIRPTSSSNQTYQKMAIDMGYYLQNSVESAFDGAAWSGSSREAATLGYCRSCDPVFPTYKGVVDRAVLRHGRAAIGIQALFTLLTQYTHDQFLFYADEVMNGSQVRLTPKNVPVAYGGYIAVVVLFVVTVLLMAGITVAYVRGAKHSMLDNFWYGVSQLVSPATAELLSHAGQTVSDEEIEKHAFYNHGVDEGSKQRLVRLGRLPEMGRMGLVLVDGWEDDDRDAYEMKGNISPPRR